MCTCTMNKLGKQAYSDKNMLYKYRGEVEVPPLQMVDDVILASSCGNQVVTSNAAVNSFIKLKKNLTFMKANVLGFTSVNPSVVTAQNY